MRSYRMVDFQIVSIDGQVFCPRCGRPGSIACFVTSDAKIVHSLKCECQDSHFTVYVREDLTFYGCDLILDSEVERAKVAA